MTKPNGPVIQFVKRVGIVCAAALGVFGVITVLWSLAVAHLIAPVIEASVAGERIARVRADSALAEKLSTLSRDRVVLLAILEAQPGVERRRMLDEVRREWSR